MEVAGGSVSAYCFATIFATVVQLYTRVPVSRKTAKTIRVVALFCKPGRRRNLEGKVENWQWFPPPLLVPSFNLHLYSILLASVIKSDKNTRIAVAIQKWKKSICKGFVKSKDYHGMIMLISILFNFQHWTIIRIKNRLLTFHPDSPNTFRKSEDQS